MRAVKSRLHESTRRRVARMAIWVLVALGLAALVAVGGNDWRARAASDRFVAVGGSDASNDCSSSGSPCATIQHAIDQAGSGDTIHVGPGTYIENVTVRQNVTIQGDGTTGSTVNGNNTGSVFHIGHETTVTLTMLTITNGNVGDAGFNSGGGIKNDGTLSVVQCTINGNKATSGTTPFTGSAGGGISTEFGSTLTVINSTISGNQAIGSAQAGGGAGGGIFLDHGVLATLVNTTINGNTAVVGGGIWIEHKDQPNFTNTIIAGSLGGGDCVSNGSTIATNSHNLVQDGSCSPAVSGDPKLGPIANNGGPTFTHALLPGSPAIDAGDDSVLGPPLNLTTDQRGPGFPRKSGLHVDIGAFEVQPVVVGPSFNKCLRDDRTGNLLQWSSTTGAYKFTRCSDGFMLTGTGVTGLVNGICTLKDSKPDRKLSAGFNTATLTGSATIYFMVAQGVWQVFRISDTNPNATCACNAS